MRLGIADHFGWAVAVTASADDEVVDRRRIELVEPGVSPAPIHYDSARLDVAATAALVAKVRASVVRATAAAFDEIAAALPAPIVSISLRAWPLDFPDDIAVQRRSPYEARADAIMYRQVLSELAHARDWQRPPLRREGRGRSGRAHAGATRRRGPARSSRNARTALDEGPSDRARRDDRRRLRPGKAASRTTPTSSESRQVRVSAATASSRASLCGLRIAKMCLIRPSSTARLTAVLSSPPMSIRAAGDPLSHTAVTSKFAVRDASMRKRGHPLRTLDRTASRGGEPASVGDDHDVGRENVEEALQIAV